MRAASARRLVCGIAIAGLLQPIAAPAQPRDGDVFPELSRGIEEEMERRRREAIEGARRAPEDRPELDLPELEAGLGVAGMPPCFDETPSARELEPLIAHRKLTRSDFQARERTGTPIVGGPGAEIAASVGVALLCVATVDVHKTGSGRYRATIDRLHFFAGLDPTQSWWNPRQNGPDEWTLRHEQLHFDIAELYAAELSLHAAEIRRRLARTAETQQLAIAKARVAFQAFFKRADAQLGEIERNYDVDTQHGNVLARQTDWFERVNRGLGAIRRGVESTGTTLRSVDALAGEPELAP